MTGSADVAGEERCTRAPHPIRSGYGAGRTAYPGGVDAYWTAVIWSLLPTVAVSAVFYFILRSILRMDRTERKAYARVEAEERAKRGLPPQPAASDR